MHMKIDIHKFIYTMYTQRNELFSITTSSGLLSMKFDIGLSVQLGERRNRNICKKYDKNLH